MKGAGLVAGPAGPPYSLLAVGPRSGYHSGKPGPMAVRDEEQ
jgi:hypothetical protein